MSAKMNKIILILIFFGIAACLVIGGIVLFQYVTKDKDNAKVSSPTEELYQYDGIKPTDEKDSGFKVVGYYPEWEPYRLDKIQYDVVTHINYAFAIPTEDSTLLPFENPEFVKTLIEQAHAHNVKVIMAVGGWSYQDVPLESTFNDATDNNLEKFGDEIVKRAMQYGFDGVDIDWEHPRFDSGSQRRYEQLMVYLSGKLKAEKMLLTAAVLSGVDSNGVKLKDAAAQTDVVLGCVDWINVMAYDGGSESRHSPYDFAVNCGTYWKDTRGLPASKIILGVPFYSRPSWSTYESILEINPDAYLTDTTMVAGKEDYYNGIQTMANKAKWAKENVGGVMIWELSQDSKDKQKSLLWAIANAIK